MAENPSLLSDALSQRSRWAGGQPISRLMAVALERPELISLAAGFVDPDSLPVEDVRLAIDALLSHPERARGALQYGSTLGHAPLRAALAERATEADQRLGLETRLRTEQTIITAGSNQLLHLVGEVLIDPGDIVLCCAPTYFVFLGTLTNLGARSVGVESDDGGMIPEALDAALAYLDRSDALDRVKALYVASYFDNPRSISLSADRRPQLVEVVRRWSSHHPIYVIDDTAYRPLRYEGGDLPGLVAYDPDSELVIETGTFSKSYCPGVRLGWGFLPLSLVGPLSDLKGNVDFGAPSLAQYAMHHILVGGQYDKQVGRLCAAYARKRDAMLRAVETYIGPLAGVHFTRPRGGLYMWLTLDPSIDTGPEGRLLHEALDAGVLYVPGQYCCPAEGPRLNNTLRLSFGTATEEQIAQGVKYLGDAIGTVSG